MIRLRRILSAFAAAVRLTALVLLLPVVVALLYTPRDTAIAGLLVPGSAIPFAVAAALAGALWLPLHILTRRAAEEDLTEREAYLAVGLGWLLCTALAGLPFLISGTLGPLEAFFEAMSGLTGTGLSALAHVDGTDVALLFWRALLQWMGGLAFIVLTAALLSRLTHGGLQFFRNESGGARIRPHLAQTARELGRYYVGLTALFAAILFLVLRIKLRMEDGPAALEALVETFAAYGNGAFTLHGPAAAAALHEDGAVQAVLSVMMLAGATNVTLAFLLVRRGQVRNLVTNPEWRFFFGLVAATVVGVALMLVRAGLAFSGSVREAAFTVTSLATGSGLFSKDYAIWPGAAQLLLMFAILVGGTAGSAAGGIKAFRALTLVKVVGREVRRLLHPRAVIPVRVGSRVVPEQTVSAVVAFFFTYLLAWMVGALLLLVVESMGVLDATSLSLAALSNVGAGFGSVGPTIGTAHLTEMSKVVLSFLMWFGRMEVFAALLVFTPSSWKH